MSITNMNELRDFMLKEMENLRSKETTPAALNAAANMAGKVMGSVKMELEYNKMVGSTPHIDFLIKEDKKLKALE